MTSQQSARTIHFPANMDDQTTSATCKIQVDGYKVMTTTTSRRFLANNPRHGVGINARKVFSYARALVLNWIWLNCRCELEEEIKRFYRATTYCASPSFDPSKNHICRCPICWAWGRGIATSPHHVGSCHFVFPYPTQRTILYHVHVYQIRGDKPFTRCT